MTPDLLLTVGVLIGILTIPSLLSAWTDGRAPRAAAIMVLIAGVLIAVAVNRKPGGYEIAEVPHVMLSVIARLVN